MSASTNALVDALRTRLLTLVPLVGPAITTLVPATRVYIDAPPRDATFPYVVLKLSAQATDGESAGEREQIELEVQCFGRLRADEATINTIADLADQAFVGWNGTSNANGVLFSRERTRAVLPQNPDPGAREEYRVRSMFSLVSWPNYLTQYANS